MHIYCRAFDSNRLQADLAHLLRFGASHLPFAQPQCDLSLPVGLPVQDCAARAFGAPGKPGHPWLGSSLAWPRTYVDHYEGSQLFADPAFSNYTIVFAPYCDGGSWTGNAARAVPTPANSTGQGKPVYYRGARLLDALLDSLFEAGLTHAQNVLWGGCSAGALTTYLHADYVAQRVGAGTRVVALADAMFSLEYEPFETLPSPAKTFPEQMAWGYENWNSTNAVDADCSAHYGEKNAWRCLFGATVAQYVQTPLFVLNSKFDTWQASAIVGAPSPDVITQENRTVQQFWLQYAAAMVSNFSALPPQHGGFLTNCPAHCQSGRATHGHDPAHRTADPWNLTTINSISLGTAFKLWYEARTRTARAHDASRRGGSTDGDGGEYRWIAAATTTPTAPDTCGYY